MFLIVWVISHGGKITTYIEGLANIIKCREILENMLHRPGGVLKNVQIVDF